MRLLGQKNISDQAKVLPLLFPILENKLENFCYSFREDLDKHSKDTLNELFHLKTDYTQV